VGISGISTGFPVLSRSSGQVAHVLLTRSPLDLHQYCYRMDLVRLACVRHAASVRPEPGSNSPLRPRSNPKAEPKSKSRLPETLISVHQLNTGKEQTLSVQCIDLATASRRDRPHWLLAITIPFSRSDQAHAQKRWCRSPNRVGPQALPCGAWRRPDGRSPGLVTLADPASGVNRVPRPPGANCLPSGHVWVV
jgi:hypothetical protein